MPTQSLFPTLVYHSPITKDAKALRDLNRQLLQEIDHLSEDDVAGIEWSQKNYPNGYTSYASANQMHVVSPTFAELETYIKKHLKKYIDDLELNIKASSMNMTTCWVNIMPSGALHTSHNHPQSTISGTYYVQIPPKSSALRLEDPRYGQFMSRPSLCVGAKHQPLHSMAAKPGDVILFESWLRHEVPLNTSKEPRVSISFNF